MNDQQPAIGLLAGIGVIEFAPDVGVRYCGRLFSALGATVVSAAPASAGTPFDHWLDQDKLSAGSVSEAVARLRGLEVTPRAVLCGQDQIAVATATRSLQQVKLDLLQSNLTWFSELGPYSDWMGDEAAILALSGLAHAFGPADGPPTLAHAHGIQILGGTQLFLTSLAALWGGRVRRVDVDILESALCFSEHAPPAYAASPDRTHRRGLNRFGAGYPTRAYPSSDGWIGVTAHTPAQWAAFCELVGRADLAQDARFGTGIERVEHAAALDAELSPILARRTTSDWLEEGQRRRIPLAPVPTPEELLETDHWLQRGSFPPLAPGSRIRAPGLPFRIVHDGFRTEHPNQVAGPPLSGIRVIDFSMGWAGPLATRHLADLGAEVIKVEADVRFDWARGWTSVPGSDPPSHEVVSAFNVMNRNKRGVAIDLSTPQGVGQAKALVASADVVIENHGPGVMDRFGLSPEALQAVRPGLVHVSMAAFGAYGPWSHFRAYGSTVEHASGLPFFNGCDDWPPSLQHLAYGDPVAGVYAATIAVAALHGRRRLGGSRIDLSQVECLFQLGAREFIGAQEGGRPPRSGSRSHAFAPRCVVPTAGEDSWLAVSCPLEAQWKALACAIGREDWLSDPGYGDGRLRAERSDEIEAALTRWAQGRDARAAAQHLQAAGVPAAPVLAARELAEDPHLAASGTWAWMNRVHVGRHMMLAPPYRLDGRRPDLLTPAPLLGEHTRQVLWPIVTVA